MLREQIQGYRLSPQQRRLWLLERDAGVPCARCRVAVSGELAPQTLRDALDRVVERHEILRTGFRRAGLKVPLQMIHERGEASWSCLDWRGRAADEQASDLDRLFQQEERIPFDLAEGPMLRATLVRLDEDRHELVLALPALCADAATLRNLVGELALALGETGGPAETVQYLQFSEWQHGLLEEEADPAAAEFWGRHDLSLLRSLALPGTAGERSGELGTFSWMLGRELAESIARAAAGHEVSESSFLFACLQALLFRLTGQSPVVCGFLWHGRKYEELETALGPMSRLVPVFARLEDDLRFSAHLRRVHAAVREAVEWQEHLRDEDDGSLARLPVAFDWTAAPPVLRAAGLSFETGETCAEVERPKLRLSGVRRPDGLALTLRFDDGLMSAAGAERLAGQLEALAAGAAADPRAPVGDLEVFGAFDRAWLRGINATDAGPSPAACIHHLFEAQAARSPAAVALEQGSERVTYAQLDARAGRLARHLRRLGTGRGELVALCLERSAEAVVALLAVLKTGAAYVPLDLASPAERLRHVLEDAGARTLITRRRLLDRLPGALPTLVCFEDEAGFDGAPLEPAADPDDLAYVLYTSGSTGRPKGVMVRHAGVVSYLAWCADAYEVERGQGAPVQSPLGFDLTVTSLLAPLVRGRKAVLLPEEGEIDALAEVLAAGEDLSLLKITPAHLEVVAQLLAQRQARPRVRSLVVGGEALRTGHLETWRQLAPDSRVFNEYGPTETVVGCCVFAVEEGVPDPIPVGRPIARAGIYVASPRLRLLPPGVTGEVLIGGAGVARGYLGRPGLTAERFIPDPFSGRPGERLYRSGDLGRWRADGELELLGRIDHQVKIRGFRVEPGEVETVLERHPGVREAAVVPRLLPSGEPALAAYVVLAPGGSSEPLRDWLRQRLPEPMVPALFVPVPELPLTANGKVDRRALPALEPAGEAVRAPYVAPRDPLELQLVRLWEELLGVRPVGVRDGFFEAGGHSLLAVRMMMQVQRRLGVEVAVASLVFQGLTVESLAQRLRGSGRGAPWTPLVALQEGGSRPPLFLVPPHGGNPLCYLDLARRLEAGRPVYGLQARGREAGQEPLASVEEMAGAYLEAVRGVQAAGPYALGGWSFGGLVAYEMARQLRAAGEEVELLAVLDASFRQERPLTAEEFLIEFVERELAIPLAELGPFDGFEELFVLARERAREKGILAADAGDPEIRRYFDFYRSVYDAAQSYRPRLYPGRVLLVVSTQVADRSPGDPTYGLEGLAGGGLEVHVVAGLHQDLVREPVVGAVASRLRQALAGTAETGPAMEVA